MPAGEILAALWLPAFLPAFLDASWFAGWTGGLTNVSYCRLTNVCGRLEHGCLWFSMLYCRWPGCHTLLWLRFSISFSCVTRLFPGLVGTDLLASSAAAAFCLLCLACSCVERCLPSTFCHRGFAGWSAGEGRGLVSPVLPSSSKTPLCLCIPVYAYAGNIWRVCATRCAATFLVAAGCILCCSARGSCCCPGTPQTAGRFARAADGTLPPHAGMVDAPAALRFCSTAWAFLARTAGA